MFIIAFLLLGSANLYVCSNSTLLALKWANFKIAHKKTYSSLEEEQIRAEIFKDNLEYIENHNAQAEKGIFSYKLKMNQFGDLTLREYNRLVNGFDASLPRLNMKDKLSIEKNFKINSSARVGQRISWIDFTTPVKNQGNCGSCYAFASNGALESQVAIFKGLKYGISEQQIVDCSRAYGNSGCSGGNTDNTYRYIYYNQGIDSERVYPYQAEQLNCRFNRNDPNLVKITNYWIIRANDESALEYAVYYYGPVAVAIDASHRSFMFFSGDSVYYEPECRADIPSLNHAVLVIGYGVQNGQQYWLVKNSWGTGWGNNGYIKMAKRRNNNCGIATYGRFPSVQL